MTDTHGSSLPQAHADLLNQITDDVASRPDFYLPAYRWLESRFCQTALHQEERDPQGNGLWTTPTFLADYPLAQCFIRAAGTLTAEGVGRSDDPNDNQRRHAAITLLACFLWSRRAHTFHPDFARFSGFDMQWGAHFDEHLNLMGRAIAHGQILDSENARYEKWIAVVSAAWGRLREQSIMPASVIQMASRKLIADMEEEERALPPAGTPAELAQQLASIAADWRANTRTVRSPQHRAGNCIRRANEAGAFSTGDWRSLAVELHGVRDLEMVLGRTQAWFAKQNHLPLETMSTPDSLNHLASAFRIDLESEAAPAIVTEEAELSDRQMLVLQTLLSLKAFDSDSRQRTQNVAATAEGKQANPESFKEAIADLVKKNLVRTKEGRGGGCWLSPTGLTRAEKVDKL